MPRPQANTQNGPHTPKQEEIHTYTLSHLYSACITWYYMLYKWCLYYLENSDEKPMLFNLWLALDSKLSDTKEYRNEDLMLQHEF